MDVVYIGLVLVLAICVVLIVALRFGEAFCLLRLKMLEIKSKENLEIERLTAEVEKYKRQLQIALYNNRRRNIQLDALHLVWCGDYSDYALHRAKEGGSFEYSNR